MLSTIKNLDHVSKDAGLVSLFGMEETINEGKSLIQALFDYVCTHEDTKPKSCGKLQFYEVNSIKGIAA